ncbi:MAG: protein translocase subunit SecD [Actinomycetota bacterium]
MSRRLGWRTFLVVVVACGSAALILSRPVRLGLDLRGGTQIVFEAIRGPGERLGSDTVDRTLEVLRRRVDQLGVSEPTLQRSGDRRIIVELPGVSDPDEALKVIGRTAQLAFHRVTEAAPPEPSPAPDDSPRPSTDVPLVLSDESGLRLRLADAAVTGAAIGDARATYNQVPPGWTVVVSFRGEGSDQFEALTGEAACAPPGDPGRRIAIVLDREIISSPEVGTDVACNSGISGETVITGDFSQQESQELALLIRAGALPVPIDVVEQRTIGPALGEQAIATSVEAGLIGGLLTILYIVAYYRVLGGLAALALVAYGGVSFAVLLAINATLTLPGIAGFVLAIGMAVDANVLVFERMKEEHAAGRTVRSAATRGFSRAWSAIADSNATTLIAALLLFWFASGAVRGFGITLTIGVAVSMFSALVITRVLVDWVIRSARGQNHPRLLGMTTGGTLHRWLSERGPDLIGRRRIWFAVSAAAIVLSLTGIFGRGLSYGIEFTGGELAEYDVARRADLNDLRAGLADSGFPRAVVQESGEGNVSIRIGQLSPAEEEEVQRAVSAVGGEAERVRSEFVGPTIGAELRRKALIALGVALLAQLVYLAVRFRWTYGASAVVAMLQDVVLLVGVFAWLGKELDGVFLASLLTVIGYSINDSVVVFDRIREQRRLRSRVPLAVVVNDACLQTIPRTINTGLGAFFILMALFVLGGETLTDFALALLIGIGVGTYSSVFTASPLVVAMERGGATVSASGGHRAKRLLGASGSARTRRQRGRR